MLIGGTRVIVCDPFACYKTVLRFKRHRKKKQRTSVKTFSHWVEVVKDGDVIHDRINNVIYMNRVTFNMVQRALEVGGG